MLVQHNKGATILRYLYFVVFIVLCSTSSYVTACCNEAICVEQISGKSEQERSAYKQEKLAERAKQRTEFEAENAHKYYFYHGKTAPEKVPEFIITRVFFRELKSRYNNSSNKLADNKLKRLGLSEQSAIALTQLALDTLEQYDVVHGTPEICNHVKAKGEAVTKADIAYAANLHAHNKHDVFSAAFNGLNQVVSEGELPVLTRYLKKVYVRGISATVHKPYKPENMKLDYFKKMCLKD